MTREEVLIIVRSKPRTWAKTPGDCYMMGRRLNEFTAEEQAEILLWALEKEQQRNADHRQTIERMFEMMKREKKSAG